MMRFLIWILGGCIGAVMIHLLAVLVMPTVSGNSVAARGLSSLPINSLSVPDEDEPQLIRFADPTALYAFCPFALSEGTLRIVSAVQDVPMSFVFVAPDGAIFSALTDRVANRGIIDLRLGNAEQIDAIADADDPANPPAEYRIVAPALSGTVVIKAFMASPSLRDAARAALDQTSCGLG